MNEVRNILLKVVSRYLTASQYRELLDELLGHKSVSDKLFVEILKRNFDFERWQTSPIIKQDLLLYNYFAYEYSGRLKCSGLMNKYIRGAFIFDNKEYVQSTEKLKSKKMPLPKGVQFIQNDIDVKE